MKASGRRRHTLARRSRLGLAATLAMLTSAFVLSPVAAVPGNDTTVLILGSTVSGGASSTEATAAAGLGLTVEVVSDGTWSEMTAEEFASYRAIILGDATCGGSPSVFTANQATWGPEVDGNVVLIGTDPVYHEGSGGGTLTDKGIAFAVDQAGKTGLYATLSCYYHGTGASTPVPAFNSLSSAGDFTVTGVGCYNDSHIVAAHPALAGLTDEILSNWSCSVHEAFDSWPSDFLVLAIAEGVGDYVAADGTTGTPYILARGEGLVAIGDSPTFYLPSIAITKSASASTVVAG
ncbi:MAG: Branched-chain amino acid transporter, amino acid-binding protein, partial [Chloroflexi bacterium]|nr:Branched-chain amino acid transporter, amino acid-binding protein [Chloroflexota bacterium]